ncbi:Uma2 family endonuclease [Crocosphaera sp. XPORK-15E]|uniref:Uma2 family endonuclease n=1 Tax=Crocosphaera sp. XPORK-15E TaxID=3110247 RepID=UPI002B215D3D|nr:Uma2 family endonuclease [Crocosphaera sp. XPORK-15E]MEA5534103.1 Uma2 family endonuclease [Crocosphaera sp. XPORK-15E]
MLLTLNQLKIPPGDRLLLTSLNWQDYEQILEELGEHRAIRLCYSQGTLEVMTPLFIHENTKVLIGDLVKVLLDELDLDYEAAGSTTFKHKRMEQGVEPDESFYIDNCSKIRGKTRIDLEIDPPPDLAIEIDITNRTLFNNYEALGVPELWRYNGKRLQINILQGKKYITSNESSIFPQFNLVEKIPETLQSAQKIGSAKALKQFRIWVQQIINH